jgi:hypothetical protein
MPAKRRNEKPFEKQTGPAQPPAATAEIEVPSSAEADLKRRVFEHMGHPYPPKDERGKKINEVYTRLAQAITNGDNASVTGWTFIFANHLKSPLSDELLTEMRAVFGPMRARGDTIFADVLRPRSPQDDHAVHDWALLRPQSNRSLSVRVVGTARTVQALFRRQVPFTDTEGANRTVVACGVADEAARPILGGDLVHVIHGDSGSGKTMYAILQTPRQPPPGGAACLYLVHEDLELDVLDKFRATHRDATSVDGKMRRDADALKLIEGAVKRVLAQFNLTDGVVPRSELNVVLDDMGGHPDFVRAVIANQWAIRDLLTERVRAEYVRLIVCGTGAHSLSVTPGSLPSPWTLYAPPPCTCVWRDLTAVGRAASSNLFKAVNAQKTPQARLAHAMVTGNARAAAWFVYIATQALDHVLPRGQEAATNTPTSALPDAGQCRAQPVAGPPDSTTFDHNDIINLVSTAEGVNCLVDLCAQITAMKCKESSALWNLSPQQHFTAVAQALQAVRTGVLSRGLWHNLVVKYGLLTDRIRRDGYDEPTLDATFHGQRFHMSRAQFAIAALATNVPQRKSTGECFEQTVADWLVWALAQTKPAPASARPERPTEGDVTITDTPRDYGPGGRWPRGWTTTSRFVSWLLGGAASQLERTIAVVQSPCASSRSVQTWH